MPHDHVPVKSLFLEIRREAEAIREQGWFSGRGSSCEWKSEGDTAFQMDKPDPYRHLIGHWIIDSVVHLYFSKVRGLLVSRDSKPNSLCEEPASMWGGKG